MADAVEVAFFGVKSFWVGLVCWFSSSTHQWRGSGQTQGDPDRPWGPPGIMGHLCPRYGKPNNSSWQASLVQAQTRPSY